jgi:hypothetical protein
LRKKAGSQTNSRFNAGTGWSYYESEAREDTTARPEG